MTEQETFANLDLALQVIKQNFLPFGGVSLLIVGEILQLPPVNQKGLFTKSGKGSYRSFNRWLWEEFQQHGQVEIVRQSSDPYFAQFLNRVEKVSKGTMT